MLGKGSRWLVRLVWLGSFVLALALCSIYLWLPADGSTGDLESFRLDGFHVQWLLEAREGGLQPGDVIVRAGGHTVDEWLSGAPRGPEWDPGGVVRYEILRYGQPLTLDIRLAPVSLGAVLRRWGLQLLVALAFLVIGAVVYRRRAGEQAAQVLMFFCLFTALQYWGDAYNFQYATIPWRWPFWFHLAYEHIVYGIGIAAVCHFTLLFPTPNPWLRRYPRLVPLVLYTLHPLGVGLGMAVTVGALQAPQWSTAMVVGSGVSWVVALFQFGTAISAGVYSVRTARDPISRAQIRWILWCASVGCAVLVPGYVLPLMLTSKALLPHPFTMLFVALIPFTLAVAILRYRLFDIEIVINRTLVYGTLTALLAGLYLLIVQAFTLVIESGWQTRNNKVALFAATLCVALVFAPLRNRVQIVIDRTFYSSKLDYERLLPEMSEKLATSIVLERLSALLTDEVPTRLKISHAMLLVLDQAGERFAPAGGGEGPTLPSHHPLINYLRRGRQPLMRLLPPGDLPGAGLAFLDECQIELSIPLVVAQQMVGLYNLGLKRSGDAYNGEEVRQLRLVGQQAAIAIENARLYKQAQQEIAERQRAEKLIKESLKEKELLLKEIHHRVKNNLQVISSLLYLQSRQIQDPAALEMFVDSQNRVRSMALVHEKLYQTQDLARVDAAGYVRTLSDYLLRSYGIDPGRIRLTVRTSDVALNVDTAIACGLIVNELISNALKHAFPGDREGEVRVEIDAMEDGQIVLVVGDDGVGMPRDLDIQNTQSMGLQLVVTLVDQIEGTIQRNGLPGTRFEITFPNPT